MLDLRETTSNSSESLTPLSDRVHQFKRTLADLTGMTISESDVPPRLLQSATAGEPFFGGPSIDECFASKANVAQAEFARLGSALAAYMQDAPLGYGSEHWPGD